MVKTRRLFFIFAVASLIIGIVEKSPAMAFEVTEVAPGLFVHFGVHEDINRDNKGDIANIGYIIGEKSVAVIDTGGSFIIGSALRTAIRQKTDLPISHVILTHAHPDHIFGTAAFAEDNPQIIGHGNLPAILAERGPFYLKRLTDDIYGPDIAKGIQVPNVQKSVAVGTDVEIDLGNRLLLLRSYPVAHSASDLTVFDQASKTLWLSDLLFRDRIPSLDGSIIGWIAVLDKLSQRPANLMIPGHGPVDDKWPASVKQQQDYLETVASGVRAIVKQGGSIRKAVKSVGWDKKNQWLLFDDYHPGNVTAAFVELEWE